MAMKSFINRLAVTLLLAASGTHAHEGHDHGPPPVSLAAEWLRAVAEGDVYELVAVLDEDQLRLYLDHADRNEPVADARIEVEADGKTMIAKAVDAGVYRVPAGELTRPGRHVLVFTLQVGEADDLLIAELEVPGEQAAAAANGSARWLGVAGGAAVLLATLALGAVIYRRRGRAPGRG